MTNNNQNLAFRKNLPAQPVYIQADYQSLHKAAQDKIKRYEADIKFLAKRQLKASSINSSNKRDTGSSSNSIVGIAYGVVKLDDQEYPSDHSDLQACENMWKKLPTHRKKGDAKIAMHRARKYIKNKYKK